LRVLGLPIEPPQAVANRMVSDLSAMARMARAAPAQFDRLLEIGEEIVRIGRSVLEITERLDARAGAIMELGERLDARAEAIMELGERLDTRAEAIMEMGERLDARAGELVQAGRDMRDAGQRIDRRGAEIVESATRVVNTGSELVTVLPAFERALQMATPLEGAIDRFGRLVDRLPGGGTRRRGDLPLDESGVSASDETEPGAVDRGLADLGTEYGTRPGATDATEPGATDATEPGGTDATEPGAAETA
jgi:hypothetical protein